MSEPTQDDILNVTLVVGCDDDLARRWLKVKNLNVDAALNAILDGDNLEQAEKANTVTWNESDFSADRNGNTTFGPQNYSYNEDNLHPLGQSAAPTRGTSPVPSLRQPSTRADEDADIQRALAASQSDQTGSNANFRPATQGYYDPSRWSMATVSGVDSQQASEIIPDLEPHERQNATGHPRFLKQLPSGDYLPNLLTIAHSIPMARRALLAPYKSYSSYGSDSDWWKGHSIRLPRIVSTVDGAPMEPATTERDEMIAEMQRLMALLDESSRSYGSAESLVRLASSFAVNRSDVTSESMLDRVLQVWEAAAKNAAPEHAAESGVFHSLIGTTSAEGTTTPNLWSLPLSVNTDSEPAVNLAEVMDNTLWDMDTDDETLCDNFMERCAPVLPMRLSQSDSSKERLSVIVPSAFYVDKYLKENVDATRDIRKQMAQCKKKIDKIEGVQYKLKNSKHPHKAVYLDATQLLKHAADYFSGDSRKALLQNRENAGAGGDIDIAPQLEEHREIAEQLSALSKEIEAKLQALEQEKEKARKVLAQLSQETPSQLSPSSLKHKYSLRGVATKPHVTYVLVPRHHLDNDMVDDEDAPEGMQWWRLEYDVQVNGARVMKSKSSQDDVLRAVELEHNQALLVYASDQAISPDNDISLPPSLKEFVQNDDEWFNAELSINGSGHGNVYPTFDASIDQRRGSGSSTVANFDNEEDPPPYDFGQEHGYIQDSKDVQMGGDGAGGGSGVDSPPAHEIKLDDMEVVEGVEKEGGGVEMVEKAHLPLWSQVANSEKKQDDDAMADTEASIDTKLL